MTTQIDELFSLGQKNYAPALYAARHFENGVLNTISEIMSNYLQDGRLCRALGEHKFVDGSFHCISPTISELPSTNFENYWALIYIQYRLPISDICFFPTWLYEGGKTYAECRFGASLPKFQIEFNRYQNGAATLKGRELTNSKVLPNNSSLQDFSNILGDIIGSLITFLELKNDENRSIWFSSIK